ncbi:RNA/RNP complex-1-interacting phosphatase, putative [Theobroma cacao]|uniref:RNA/RNP complex-1-interacting phosphatase, putative n=1 Tax=Theobroma cacao TaxID=3641 RepID=A0A061DV78_THECC|nr:RNA/RNP complex-1-interacting phosphatase, putative [Theobroma cacao]
MASAALSVHHSFYYKNSSAQELKSRSRTRNCPRILIVLSCQNNEPIERSTTKAKKGKDEKRQLFALVFTGVQKFGRGLKENMSPQQKGDWKDVMLMSLSFAVYVYMSQKIVCAYVAWMSMPRQPW